MSIQNSTKEPVTTSGWYERTDGTVTRYDWRNGVLVEGATVPSFADVPEVDHAADDRASRAKKLLALALLAVVAAGCAANVGEPAAPPDKPALASRTDELTCLGTGIEPLDIQLDELGQPIDQIDEFVCSPSDPFEPAMAMRCARSIDAAPRFACIVGLSATGEWFSFDANRDAFVGHFMGRRTVRYVGGIEAHECGEPSDLLPVGWCP